MLVDSHCHLDSPELVSRLDQVVAAARVAGVERMVTVGTQISTFSRVRAIAEAYDFVYCTVGVHPEEAANEAERITVDRLIAEAAHPKVIALGETGLDYFYEAAPRSAQEALFRTHIRAALATGLPLSIHTREAEADTVRILSDEMKTAGGKTLRAVLHCFSSRRELAEAGLAMGFFFSLTGMLTFKKADDLRAIVRDLPLDRLMVETDSPYLAPVPFRGKTCEPAFVVHTAQKLAEIKGVPMADIERATTDAFFRLFDKVPR
jgi:TatD DNase family protein